MRQRHRLERERDLGGKKGGVEGAMERPQLNPKLKYNLTQTDPAIRPIEVNWAQNA